MGDTHDGHPNALVRPGWDQSGKLGIRSVASGYFLNLTYRFYYNEQWYNYTRSEPVHAANVTCQDALPLYESQMCYFNLRDIQGGVTFDGGTAYHLKWLLLSVSLVTAFSGIYVLFAYFRNRPGYDRVHTHTQLEYESLLLSSTCIVYTCRQSNRLN